jgi:hypothetical protein
MNNSAPFEISDTMGTNLDIDVDDVLVSDSEVIRVESEFDSMERAVFSAHQGGKGNLSNYTFRNIHIENADFRLFSLAVRPSPWSQKNVALGSPDGDCARTATIGRPRLGTKVHSSSAS